MKPEERLEELIVKYNIGMPCEQYSLYLKAKKLLNQLVSKMQTILLVSEDLADAAMVKNVIEGKKQIYRCETNNIEMLKRYRQNCDIILFVSYSHEGYEKWLEEQSNCSVKTVFLYQYFKEKDLNYSREFYDVLGGKRIGLYGDFSKEFSAQNYYEALYQDKKKYLLASEKVEKEKALQKLIFDYVFIKDFVYTKKYIEKYINDQYENFERYISFWSELEHLLNEIRQITIHQKDHIFIFWLDGLGKGEEEGMPFFNALEEKGLVFDNAFTVTPTTSLTMKAIFLKKRFYEDAAYKIERISEKDSSLIGYLKNRGYQFQYYGFEERFEEKIYAKNVIMNTPSSMMHWYLLCDLCETEQSKCYLIHDLPELHVPFQSGLVEDFFHIFEAIPKTEVEKVERHIQRKLGKQYLDEQIEFYHSFISNDAKQIFMSDHASEQGVPRRGNGSHINLIALGKGIKNQHIKKMFSYINFELLIKYMCELDEGIWKQMLKDYVLVQYPDTYSKKFVRNAIQNKSISLSSFGWKGCVTQDDEFFVYTIGEEVYHVYPSWVNRVRLPECENRVQYLRQITGRKFDDVQKNPFFRYTRLLYQVWNNYIDRTGGKERGVELLQKAVAQIAENKVIAIRGGGKHTSGVLAALGAAAARVKYIVDRNTVSDVHFEGPGLHLEVITPDEMQKRRIDVVIISSLPYRNEMKAELLETGIKYQIIDVYEMLEEEGIFLDRGFYQINLQQEDYVEVEIL